MGGFDVILPVQQRGVPYWFRIPFLPLPLEYLTSSPLYILRGSDDLGRDGGAIARQKEMMAVRRSQMGRKMTFSRSTFHQDCSCCSWGKMQIACHRDRRVQDSWEVWHEENGLASTEALLPGLSATGLCMRFS